MCVKNTKVKIRPIQTVPAEAAVCHFDELGEAAKQHLSELASSQTGEAQQTTDQTVVDVLENCSSDIVKFTEFYRIESC